MPPLTPIDIALPSYVLLASVNVGFVDAAFPIVHATVFSAVVPSLH